MDTTLQNLESFSSEFVASSSKRQYHLENKLSLSVAKQEEMDIKLQVVIARQDETGSDLRTILELLQ